MIRFPLGKFPTFSCQQNGIFLLPVSP